MTHEEPLLDRERLREIFRLLGERLQRRGVVGEVYVIGGAAIALAYDARRATRDVDAVYVPHGIVQQEAQALGRELGLPPWWLNEQVSVYAAPQGDPQAAVTFWHPGLRVSAASPEHLLAMKVIASRRRDADDIQLLVARLGLTSVQEVVAVCERVFPQQPLARRSLLLLEDLLGAPEGG